MNRNRVQVDEAEFVRIGKDEINLVEYPFAALSTKPSADATILQTWQAKHPTTGRPVIATWRVEGSRELGLPNATDERVYLVLMELTREAGMAQEVYFTRYEILRRLGWPIGKTQYEVLQNSFRRLKSVIITSENAFWNPEAKSFVNIGFNIIDNYKILASKPGRKSNATDELPLSFFRWNDVIYNSLRNGYIRSLDLGFALSLKLPLALRLYRYLDKKSHDGKSTFEIELRRLCELHLGMTPTAHNSTIKVRLAPAHAELIERGYLQDVSYGPMKSKKGEKVCYTFRSTKVLLSSGGSKQESEEKPLEQESERKIKPPEQVAEQSTNLFQRMLDIDVSTAVVETFHKTIPHEVLQEQLDCLADRHPDDPAATFVSAIRGGWKPPVAYYTRKEAEAQAAATAQQRQQRAQEQVEAAHLKAEREAQEKAEITALDATFEQLAAPQQAEVDAEVGWRLQFVVEHLGRQAALNGWQATRRQVLRERAAHAGEPDADTECEEAEQQRLRRRILLSKDSELDRFYESLCATRQQEIIAAVQAKLQTAGMGDLTEAHPGWPGVRRTVLRQMLQEGSLAVEADGQGRPD